PFFAERRDILRPFRRDATVLREGRRVPRAGRLDWLTRRMARTSSGLVIECQRAMPFRLAMPARVFRDRDFRASEVIRATPTDFPAATEHGPAWRGKSRSRPDPN